MLHNRFANRRGQRRGIVLLIVITMLALFATMALAFVYYADAEAAASQLATDAANRTLPDASPELLLTYALREILYGSNNYSSATRGHELLRTMYGANPNNPGNPYNVYPGFPGPPYYNPNNPTGLNFSAYSGIGRLHYMQAVLGDDDYYYPNYQYFQYTDGFLRDPEIYGSRANPSAMLAAYRAGNAPYTYPDANNMFLAQVSAAGEVIANSFHRGWLQQYAAKGANAAQNLKYAILYPDSLYYHNGLDKNKNPLLKADGQPLGPFNPVGADPGGHVRNLDNSIGFLLPTSITVTGPAGFTLPPPVPPQPFAVNLSSTAGLPASGIISINISAGVRAIITYTGLNASGLTGCICVSGIGQTLALARRLTRTPTTTATGSISATP